MKILENLNLIDLNTFGIKAHAKYFVEIEKESDLLELLETEEYKNNKHLFLGGGSNVLFIQDYDGIVILNKLKGIEILKEDEQYVWVKAMAGEVWHDLVSFSVERNYWGIENLALIPGTVGASPIQNIGAYGREIKDVLESVEAINLQTDYSSTEARKRIFTNTECEFGYRDSVFKNKLKGQYFVSSIILKLSKIENKNIEYKILQKYLEENNTEVKNPKDVSDAVISIRRSKLPDPKTVGNAGSFFKNPFISKEKLETLLKEYPDMPHFVEGEQVKVPAGWLIEKIGWKGKTLGQVGTHTQQALVIVNHGDATGEEIKQFAENIIKLVDDTFGIQLIPEVNLI